MLWWLRRWKISISGGSQAGNWWLPRRIIFKQEKREKLRERQELFLVQGVGAAIALGEATAKAVQRIPDTHCNGDMHAALDYAAKVKHAQKDFLTQQGIEALYD